MTTAPQSALNIPLNHRDERRETVSWPTLAAFIGGAAALITALVIGLALLAGRTLPSGGEVAYVNGIHTETELAILDARTGLIHIQTANRLWDSEPAWSPDGQQIAYVSEREGRRNIYVSDIFGDNERQITDSRGRDYWPSWSPDGRFITFESWLNDNPEIYVIDITTGDERRLTRHPGKHQHPVWSPDGARIAVVSYRALNWDIYIIDLLWPEGTEALPDAEQVRRLTDNPGRDEHPTWSPDGVRLAFMSSREDNTDLYVMDAQAVLTDTGTLDGANLQRLTSEIAWDAEPSWSADGRSLVFRSNRTANDELYVYTFGADSITRLTYNDTRDEFPVWRP